MELASHADRCCQHLDKVCSIKVLLKKSDRNAHHYCDLLDRFNSFSRLVGPPSIRLGDVRCEDVSLNFRELKFFGPLGKCPIGQARRHVVSEPSVGHVWNDKKAAWIERRRW